MLQRRSTGAVATATIADQLVDQIGAPVEVAGGHFIEGPQALIGIDAGFPPAPRAVELPSTGSDAAPRMRSTSCPIVAGRRSGSGSSARSMTSANALGTSNQGPEPGNRASPAILSSTTFPSSTTTQTAPGRRAPTTPPTPASRHRSAGPIGRRAAARERRNAPMIRSPAHQRHDQPRSARPRIRSRSVRPGPRHRTRCWLASHHYGSRPLRGQPPARGSNALDQCVHLLERQRARRKAISQRSTGQVTHDEVGLIRIPEVMQGHDPGACSRRATTPARRLRSPGRTKAASPTVRESP